ncbi:MAG: glutamate racemase [Methylocella sp.]
MTAPRILLFDSGMGGLTVARAVAAQLPDAHLVYAADNAAFPYGDWREAELASRIVHVMGALLALTRPHIAIVACNAASTVALAQLREAYSLPFVGTVPAIKPAAAQTVSGMVGVLATPGTVSREYTRALIDTHARHCEVILHGAKNLAEMAERKLQGHGIDHDALRREVAPVFRERDGKRTDVVVLGCTHYPLLLEDIAQAAPWPVRYLDPAPAIARRAADVLAQTPLHNAARKIPAHGTALFTSSRTTPELLASYGAMGFPRHEIVDMPV